MSTDIQGSTNGGLRVNLSVIDGDYSVYRFDSHEQIPRSLFSSDSFLSITKTDDELSVVCKTSFKLDPVREEHGWKLLKLEGPIAFSTIGIISSISLPLASAKISIFVVSTYDTDYILVKNEFLERACAILTGEGFTISRG